MAATHPAQHRSLSIANLLFIGLDSLAQLQNAAETHEIETSISSRCVQRGQLNGSRRKGCPSITKWKDEMAFAVAKLSECTLAGLFPEDLVVEKHAKDVSSKSQDTRRKIGAQSRKSREAQERTVERIRLVGVQVKEAERISDATLKPLSIDPEEFCKRVCDEIKKRRKESEESVALKSRIEALDRRIAQSRDPTHSSANSTALPLPPDLQRLVDELNSPSNRDRRYPLGSPCDTLPPVEGLRQWATKIIVEERDALLQSAKSRIKKHLEELLQNLVQEVEDITKPGRNLVDWLTLDLEEDGVKQCVVPRSSSSYDESDGYYEPEEGEIWEDGATGTEGSVMGDVTPFDSGDEAPTSAFSDGQYELEEGELPGGERVTPVEHKEEKLDQSQGIRQSVSNNWGSLIVDFPMDLDDVDDLEMGTSELDSRVTGFGVHGLAAGGGDGSLSFDGGASNTTVESSPTIETTASKVHHQEEDRETNTISTDNKDRQTPQKTGELFVTPPDTLATVFRRPALFLALNTHRRISYSGE